MEGTPGPNPSLPVCDPVHQLTASVSNRQERQLKRRKKSKRNWTEAWIHSQMAFIQEFIGAAQGFFFPPASKRRLLRAKVPHRG